MKKAMYFAAIAAISVGTLTLTSCHKDKLPKPKKVDPLSLINGQLGSPLTFTIDYSQSVDEIISSGFLWNYSQATYPTGSGGKVSITCVPVSFDRVIPIDTVKLWMAYKKMSAATSQDLAQYGNELYKTLVLNSNNDDMQVVSIGDKASNGDYLELGDSDGDYSLDVTDVTASSFTAITQYLAVQ